MTLALESQCRNSRERSGKQRMWGGLLLAASIMAIVAPLFCSAQDATTLSPEARKFVRVADPAVALTHVRAIDGTATARLEDQTVCCWFFPLFWHFLQPWRLSNRAGPDCLMRLRRL